MGLVGRVGEGCAGGVLGKQLRDYDAATKRQGQGIEVEAGESTPRERRRARQQEHRLDEGKSPRSVRRVRVTRRMRWRRTRPSWCNGGMRSAVSVLAALCALSAAVAPAAAAPADAARARLSDACNEDERPLPDKPRFVFATGPERAAAVDALAARLRATVDRRDVPALSNGYLGEAEKSVARLLQAAERTPVVLFFDEADALFRPRTADGEALMNHLGAATSKRVIVLGLRERPAVGRLGKFALAALPAPKSAPWAAVCGTR